MNIVGLSGHFHDAAACLLRDGEVVAAVQEGRLTRWKHDPRLPVLSWRWVLEATGLTPAEIDCVAWYEEPEARAARQVGWGQSLDVPDPVAAIREQLGYEGPVRCFDHHRSHAASAFLFSPWDEAAVLTADGVGGAHSATFSVGRGAELERIGAIEFPHSLGLLYSAVTAWLGFEVLTGEAKVMGLAAHGEPSEEGAIRSLIRRAAGPRFELDLDGFDFREAMFTVELCRRLGAPPRAPGAPLMDVHCNLAASLQAVTEEILLEWLDWLHREAGLDRLCYAGGVALNCKANGRLLAEGPFTDLFVQPAAGDAGGALGAAGLAHVELTGERPGPLRGARLGPSVDGAVRAAPLDFDDFAGRPGALYGAVVDRLARGEVVAWCQGRLEWGPRALGGRSLLADPRRPEMRDRINLEIKRREPFRPLAPAVLAEHAHDAWDGGESPYMLRAHRARPGLPAATHVDGSTRVQTVDAVRAPRFHALLEAWHARTGCPALLNTSFNVREPIVCTAADALRTFASAPIDALVVSDVLIDRAALPASWPALVEATRPARRVARRRDLYTF